MTQWTTMLWGRARAQGNPEDGGIDYAPRYSVSAHHMPHP